jgi:dipeptidyl aminopeptidase/acylaminoacyl peptidase
VDYSGPTDFTHGSGGLVGATAAHEAPILIKLFGGTFKEKPEVWRQASPLACVASNSAPFLIVHGDQDNLVPMAMAESLTAALKQAGVPVNFIRVKNGDHGLRAAQGVPAAEPNEAMLQKIVLTFLDKYLKK